MIDTGLGRRKVSDTHPKRNLLGVGKSLRVDIKHKPGDVLHFLNQKRLS